MKMKYTHSLEDDKLILTFDGDLIGEENGPALVELVSDMIATKKIKFCLADISNIRYINSSGIGVLITILTKIRNKGGEMYLINPSDHVRKLLIITKLQAIFNIVNSVQEAITKSKDSQ